MKVFTLIFSGFFFPLSIIPPVLRTCMSFIYRRRYMSLSVEGVNWSTKYSILHFDCTVHSWVINWLFITNKCTEY
jgi:ABC-type uncharacterized transport system permease subunit